MKVMKGVIIAVSFKSVQQKLVNKAHLLDHLVKMHDQYIMDLLRQCKHLHEKKHRELRKRQKKAVDTVIDAAQWMIDWPDEKSLCKSDFWKDINKNKLLESINDLHIFKRLEERGYGDILLARYPSLRKYFSDFIKLPFQSKHNSDSLMKAIHIIRKLDSGEIINYLLISQ
jgi:hypothetical protein